MKLDFIRQRPSLLTGILILYYLVGLMLFLVGQTRSLFNLLTPFTLIISFASVLLFQKEWKRTTSLAFGLVFLGSLFVEVIGVNTGVLFGRYVYGSALGIKIFDTPVMIGLNWLILIYCTAAIANSLSGKRIARMFIGSALMVAYDLILEYIAPIMNMWSWDTRYPGPKNFIMWFITAFVFHFLFQKLNLQIENKPARYLFFIQFLFFACIALYVLFMPNLDGSMGN